MNWISVKQYGLPRPDKDQLYIIYHCNGGLGYGRYYFEYSIDARTYLTDVEARWWLDFDAVGDEDNVLYYMEIELPEGSRYK